MNYSHIERTFAQHFFLCSPILCQVIADTWLIYRFRKKKKKKKWGKTIIPTLRKPGIHCQEGWTPDNDIFINKAMCPCLEGMDSLCSLWTARILRKNQGVTIQKDDCVELVGGANRELDVRVGNSHRLSFYWKEMFI